MHEHPSLQLYMTDIGEREYIIAIIDINMTQLKPKELGTPMWDFLDWII